MGGISSVTPIMAIVAAVVLIAIILITVKKKDSSKGNSNLLQHVNFCITSASDMREDGTVCVDGIVKNNPITVGESFYLVDSDDNILDSNVVVEGIEGSAGRAPVNEFVTLVISTRCATIDGEAFLKKFN